MAFGQTIEGLPFSWGGAALAPGYGENGLRPIIGHETRNMKIPNVCLVPRSPRQVRHPNLNPRLYRYRLVLAVTAAVGPFAAVLATKAAAGECLVYAIA